LFVRYVLSTEPWFRSLDAPGHYWTCTDDPAMEEDITIEQFDLGILLCVAHHLQKYGYPAYRGWIGPFLKRKQS
ncbi:hypothetical protein FRB95_010485, partial [Tulasnella sp. JGI-2019a]